jgi:hypothetical protein
VIGRNLARIVGDQIYPAGAEDEDRGMAPALQIGRMSVAEDIDAEWNAWYNNESIPGFRTVPGVIFARRYRVAEGDVRYTTVYEFEHDKVSETAEWLFQRDGSSPKSGRMRSAMAMAPGSPGVYRRVYP